MTTVIPAPAGARRSTRFFTLMAAAALLTVIVGFAPSYYLRSRFASAPLPLFLQVHGFLFSAWMLFLLLQSTLVAAGRTGWHRRAGWAGAALALVMVPTGSMAGIWSMRAQVLAGNVEPALAFLTTPLLSMLVFGILAGTGIAYRRRPEYHKRLLLLATINLLDAPVARWPLAIVQTSPWALYLVTDLFLVALIAHDWWTRRAVHPATAWGACAVVIGQAVRTPLGNTALWQSFARVLLGV